MEELLYKLLQQTPLVIVLVLGIWYFTKQIEKKDKEFAAERKQYRKEIKDLNQNHAIQVKDLNAFVHKESKQNAEALIKLADTIDDFIDK